MTRWEKAVTAAIIIACAYAALIATIVVDRQVTDWHNRRRT